MRITNTLNFVIPVDVDGKTIYVHSTPVGREIFERYFLVLSKTFSALYTQSLGIVSGPRVAMLLLKKIAQDSGEWDGPDGVESGLVNDIKRLTNVAVSGPNGWEQVPYVRARKDGLIDDDDASEVENALAFFTVASRMHKRTELKATLQGAAALWGGEVTSLSCSEYIASLQPSTSAATSTMKISSVPV